MSKPTITDIQAQLPHNGSYPTRPLSAVTVFAVHYDGVDIPNGYDPVAWYVREAQEHISRDWGGGAHGAGLMYHYCIDRSGGIYATAPETALTWNAYNANSVDLAIKVDSGPNTPATDAQKANLTAMLGWLCTERPDMPATTGDVYGHGELTAYGNATDCPGDALRAFCQAYRTGAAPAMDPVEALLHEIGALSYLVPVPATEIQTKVQQALAAGGWKV